ncbi:MAG: hypothetical protein K8F36_14735 [Melioribacteraceae bacterium]|nr:hypothetical protein [Melioribacteraceae bacterium]
MESDNIKQLYEDSRQLLINTEPLTERLTGIRNPQLKETLKDYVHTVQSDLLILTDLLFELITCEDETEIEFLINTNRDINELVN